MVKLFVFCFLLVVSLFASGSGAKTNYTVPEIELKAHFEEWAKEVNEDALEAIKSFRADYERFWVFGHDVRLFLLTSARDAVASVSEVLRIEINTEKLTYDFDVGDKYKGLVNKLYVKFNVTSRHVNSTAQGIKPLK